MDYTLDTMQRVVPEAALSSRRSSRYSQGSQYHFVSLSLHVNLHSKGIISLSSTDLGNTCVLLRYLYADGYPPVLGEWRGRI
eukprot:scaffold11743_cov95-Skeletonema_dohrnii-CCMP3373.AAC.1